MSDWSSQKRACRSSLPEYSARTSVSTVFFSCSLHERDGASCSPPPHTHENTHTRTHEKKSLTLLKSLQHSRFSSLGEDHLEWISSLRVHIRASERADYFFRLRAGETNTWGACTHRAKALPRFSGKLESRRLGQGQRGYQVPAECQQRLLVGFPVPVQESRDRVFSCVPFPFFIFREKNKNSTTNLPAKKCQTTAWSQSAQRRCSETCESPPRREAEDAI